MAVTQFLKKIEDDVHVGSVTVKAYDVQLAALTKRLTPELNVLYTSGYDGFRPTAGMSIYEQLETQMKKMKTLSGLIQAYHATSGDMATAEALHTEQTVCVAAGVIVSNVVSSTVCARKFQEQRELENFDVCAELMDPTKEVDMGVGKLSEEKKKELQGSVLLVQVINLLKAGTEIPKEKKEEHEAAVCKGADTLHKFLQALKNKSVKVLDEDLERDVARLTVLVQVAVYSKEVVVPEAELVPRQNSEFASSVFKCCSAGALSNVLA